MIYLFPGFIIDIFYNNFKILNFKIIFLAVICGFAYMTIPITRAVITLAIGFPFGTFAKGFLFPILTHFIFGFAGGLIPAGIDLFRQKKK